MEIRVRKFNHCFRDIKALQKFASLHASIHNHSHGEWLVKEMINSLCAWYSSAVMGSKSEPLSTTRPFAEPVKLTSGPAAPTGPLCWFRRISAVEAQEDGATLQHGYFSPMVVRSVHLDPARLIRPRGTGSGI